MTESRTQVGATRNRDEMRISLVSRVHDPHRFVWLVAHRIEAGSTPSR